jgi:hypothetical protein
LGVTTYLVWFAVIVSAFGLIASLMMNKRLQHREYDRGTNKTTAKHPFLANPIVIAYVVFPVVLLIGVAILMMLYY